MMTVTLSHLLDRNVLVAADRDVVFRFLSDDARWAAWWGAGSSIDPRPGGAVRIRYPDGTEVAGTVEEIVPPARLVFTYGYVSGAPIPPGASRVTIALDEEDGATRVRVRHAFEDASVRDLHVQGWRFQLSLFSNAVANEMYREVSTLVDAWFDAWTMTVQSARDQALAAIAAPAVTFRDQFSAVEGLADLTAHIAGAQRFMPGIAMQRLGAVNHCQGTALVRWSARTADGQERGHGANVFTLDAQGKIAAVVGFWNA
jgi:uncharacterized protein YndB with AHSA1/START domain